MPWGHSEKALENYKKHLGNKKDVNIKARKLYESRIKKIATHDAALYYGVFVNAGIYYFCLKNEVKQPTILCLLIIDTYEVFFRKDLYMWGFVGTPIATKRLSEDLLKEGVIEEYLLLNRKKAYFITLKGRDLINRFKEFYDAKTKQILKNNKNGNVAQRYKYYSRPIPENCSF